MDQLKNCQIKGEPMHVGIVHELFGDVYFGGLNSSSLVLTVTKVFRNAYFNVRGLLYVVVPNETILNVWPGRADKFDEVKYGTATSYDANGRSFIITPAIAMHKDPHSLYLCLTANGILLEERDSFGI